MLLKEPKHNPAEWNVIQPTDDPEWLAKSTAGSAWPSAFISIHYATTLEKKNPDVARLLDAIQLDSETITQMTKAVVVDKIPQAVFARQWVTENADRIDGWLEL